MLYCVTFTHYGFATVEADSEEGAFEKAEALGKEDIDWSDNFEASSVSQCKD